MSQSPSNDARIAKLEAKMDIVEQEIKTQKANYAEILTAVTMNTTVLTNFSQESKGILEFYRDTQGIFRVYNRLQSFAISVTKWGLVATAVTYILSYVKSHLPTLFG